MPSLRDIEGEGQLAVRDLEINIRTSSEAHELVLYDR